MPNNVETTVHAVFERALELTMHEPGSRETSRAVAALAMPGPSGCTKGQVLAVFVDEREALGLAAWTERPWFHGPLLLAARAARSRGHTGVWGVVRADGRTMVLTPPEWEDMRRGIAEEVTQVGRPIVVR